MNVLVLPNCDFLVRNCDFVHRNCVHALPIYVFVHPKNVILERNCIISSNLSGNWLFLTTSKAKPPASGLRKRAAEIIQPVNSGLFSARRNGLDFLVGAPCGDAL